VLSPHRPLPHQEEDFEADFEYFGVKAGDSELDSTDEAMTFAAPGAHSPEVTTGSSQSPELSLSVTPFLAVIAVPLEEKTSTVDFVWEIPLSLLFSGKQSAMLYFYSSF
jgi:hypothetical protein